MSTSPQFPSSIKNLGTQIVNATGTSFVTLMSAGTSGSRIDMVSVANTDASNAYVLQIGLRIGATDYTVGEVTVPAGAGTNGTAPAVTVLDPTTIPGLDNTLNVLFLAASCALRVRSKTAVSGSNALNVVAIGGDY